ncbi:RNA polymerase sigma factor [Alkalihalobacillus trypoxylicola]|uniref:RNA polymerase subunit sigma n=1 Tax=Alkalihalobacillus trypoxylicola TaxID=519424 RepID=A0A162EKN6_9BACI|nr:RNA polymerase sigma factor [Alkalihalobacillus trypoxylicola]KYG33134.1 RNA polymerase subunit sigma [Alkalihalobacillus trypoxylicola]GAF65332.1 putative RNA polymerase [Bacillus sp. TS-2]
MEEDWIKRAKAGDDEAFHLLMDKHIKTVERFSYQMGVSQEKVDDVVQEVFIKVYRFITKQTHGKFTTWLYSLTLNVIRDMYRQEQRQIKKFKLLKKSQDSTSYIESYMDHDSFDLHEKIQQLDAKYKVPIILHYFHDLNYKEIAGVLGVSEGAIKSRILRAKKMLKEKYEKVGEHNG